MITLRVFYFAMLLGLCMVVIPPVINGQTYTVLYELGNTSSDPLNPQYPGMITQGRDGNLYTAAHEGGSEGNEGAAFWFTPAGVLTNLYNFGPPGGAALEPEGGISPGTDGNYYGTTIYGGDYNCYYLAGCGTVFQLTPAGALTVLYQFTGGTDGKNPFAPPIMAADGDLYGTTQFGGKSGYGTVYKLTLAGVFTTLYSFGYIPDGANPVAPLSQGTDGNLYGTTITGGYSDDLGGTIFRISTSGNFKVLYMFTKAVGIDPYGALIQGSDGSFYGTTWGYGTLNNQYGYGTVFRITPNGLLTTLHVFDLNDGETPQATLVQATDGYLYGTAALGGTGSGTLFRVSPKGKNFTVLHYFDATPCADGCIPLTPIIQHTNGTLYAVTSGGGLSAYNGVIYSLDVGLKPFAKLLPASGKSGASVGVFGQGLTGTTRVTFNGKAAKFSVNSDTYLTATVPRGATSGFVAVKTHTATLKSNVVFRVK